MRDAAKKLAEAKNSYRSDLTRPEHWAGFQPRTGDVLLVTPAKSGTTWTQSMIAMLLKGTAELPERLGTLSPWFDGGFGALKDYQAALAAQSGRRVIKSHTPALGIPVWKGVPVVTVFRHPLEVFLSIRKHLANARPIDAHPLLAPIDKALPFFLDEPFDAEDIDKDCLAAIVTHFEEIVLTNHVPQKLVLHYAGILADHAGTVAKLDAFLGTGASPELQAAITKATGFSAMKSRAAVFAPEANNDLWHDDKAFFAGGQSGHSRAEFTETQIAAYDAAFTRLLPNPAHRRWIETGYGDV